MEQIGNPASLIVNNNVGDDESFAGGLFTATLINKTATSLTSVASGTVSQTIDGYTLQCFNPLDQAVFGHVEISIPRKLFP